MIPCPLRMLLLFLVVPMLFVAAVPRIARRGGVAERFVYGIAAWEASLLAAGLALGLTHRLTIPNYRTFTICAGAAAALAAVKAGSRSWRFPRHARAWIGTRRGAACALLAAGVAATVAVQLAADAAAGSRHWDGLWYHVPRIQFWMQQGSFDAWATPSWQQVGLPVGGDVVLGAKILLGLGWAGSAYVTALLTLGAVAGVFLVGLDLGLGRWRSAVAALLFASFPAVGGRIAEFSTDVAAAFPVVAGYVALRRVEAFCTALFAFLLLAAIGVACKPTVAPLAVILAAVAFWSSRRRFVRVENVAPAVAASALGAGFVVASYWPVFRAFGDFLGGEVGRACAVSGAREHLYAAVVGIVQWLLEPLGYVPAVLRRWTDPIWKDAYAAIGLRLDHGILGATTLADWRPMPGPASGRSGLVPLVLFPAVGAALPSPAARKAVVAWWAGVVSIGALIYAQPWSGRFTILLLAAYALAWAGSRLFSRGRRRWALAGIAGLNVAAGLGVTLILTWLYWGVESREGGKFHYLDPGERARLANTLAGSSLSVVADESLDALLVGPEMAFPLRYVVCPADGDWAAEFRRAEASSRAVAVVHRGKREMRGGPSWSRPGAPACPVFALATLRGALEASGWTPSLSTDKLDIWVASAAGASSR